MTMFATPIETYSVLPAPVNLAIVRGDNFLLDMQLVYGDKDFPGFGPNDQSVQLDTTTVSMKVRRSSRSPVVLEPVYRDSDSLHGEWNFFAPDTDTAELSGSYLYDVQVGNWYTIMSGGFYVQDDYVHTDAPIKNPRGGH